LEDTWREIYVVSPRNGQLYIFPEGYWKEDITPGALDTLGLYVDELDPDLGAAINEGDRVPSCRRAGFTGMMRGKFKMHANERLCRLIGMRRTLAVLAGNGTRASRVRHLPVARILAQVKSEEGPEHGPYCLRRALRRWELLHRHGYNPDLSLGVAVPSNNMHSWVSIDGMHIGENPDEVVAYTEACRFFTR